MPSSAAPQAGGQLANANLYRAFDMEAKGWLLVDPGSAAGLGGSMKAAERGENWFGYWSPTAMIGKYVVPSTWAIGAVPRTGMAHREACRNVLIEAVLLDKVRSTRL